MKKLRLNSIRDLAKLARIPEGHLKDISERAPDLYFVPARERNRTVAAERSTLHRSP